MSQLSLSVLLLLSALWVSVGPVGAAVRLAYTRLDGGHWQVWSSEASGDKARPVTSSAWDKRCLRAGGRTDLLLLRDNEGKIHRLDLTRGGAESAVSLGFEVVKDFDFSPENGFLVASYAPNALDNVCVWHVPREGQPKRLLISDPYLNETPQWFPKGDRFLFAKSHAGRSHLCVSELAKPKAGVFLKRALSSASEPRISPDGMQVVFCGQGGASIDLWICSADGTEARELYAGPGLETEPSWTPDGEWVYFTTWDGKNFRLARIQPTGREFSFVSAQGVDCRCPVVINMTGENHE